MATHVQAAGQVTGYRDEVLGGEALRRDGRVHGHLKVLAPSGEGVVRPAKPDVGKVVARRRGGAPHKRDGGKLRVAFLVKDGGVVAQLKVAKARTCRKGRELALDVSRGKAAEQAVIVLRPMEVREVCRPRYQRVEPIYEPVGVIARRRYDALAADHAELGERGGVHGGQRGFVKGLEARVKVIEEVQGAILPWINWATVRSRHICLQSREI